jgi:hypothetical protein
VSAEPDNEVLDLQQVTPVVPPDKKVPPAVKKASSSTERESKSREQIRAEVQSDLEREEAMRAEIRAELEAEYAARLATRPAPADASDGGLEETNYLHIEPGPGEIVIHMIDDGLTYGPRVYMRGEELAVNPEKDPWVDFSRTQQIQRFGKALFSKGPWPYGGYDLTDPALSAEDKKRLLQATRSESFA